MNENTKRSGPLDSRRINIDHEYEVRYWASEFNVSPEKLREAVKTVGTSAEVVRKYLKER